MSTTARGRRERRIEIPRCRDPFINSLLMPVGHSPGEPERFWIGTWNTVEGSTGALVEETGAFRLYHFREPLRPGFYSVAAEDVDTLWLWGNLSEVVRLSLPTGEYECFPTGGPEGLVFHGMAFDRAGGKLLAVANTYSGEGPTAISFDIGAREVSRIYPHIAQDCYLRGHVANGDGTFTVVAGTPGVSLLHWDPASEEIEVTRISKDVDAHGRDARSTWYRLVQDDAGRVYMPYYGWYDPLSREFVDDGPRPAREMTWFARHGDTFVGAASRDGDSAVAVWDPASGEVTEVARCRDCSVLNLNLTASGGIVGVSLYGEFTRRDLHSGRLEISRLLPATGVQHTDCLRMIDQDRLLGTPFITQRFWEANLETGEGFDCGRAAPGGGEILQTWRIGDRIFMAEYGGGRLVEYDPNVHPHFPENPRVVANPPASNRPIAAAGDGRCIYYSCSAPYGRLGSTLTRYDTETGISNAAVNPIPNQRIVSLAYDADYDRLLAATHFDADGRSCPPASDRCYIAELRADDLAVATTIEAPGGASGVSIIGPLASDRWLCRVTGSFDIDGVAVEDMLLQVGGEPLELARTETAWPVPAGWGAICPTPTPGRFTVQVDGRVELWDLDRRRRVEVLSTEAADRRLLMDRDTIFLLGDTDVLVLQNALP